MKKNLVKTIVLGLIGGFCILRGLCGFRGDNHDYTEDGVMAGVTYAMNKEIIRQANNDALQMVAIGTLVLLASAKPWNEYKREKAERDELFRIDEEE